MLNSSLSEKGTPTRIGYAATNDTSNQITVTNMSNYSEIMLYFLGSTARLPIYNFKDLKKLTCLSLSSSVISATVEYVNDTTVKLYSSQGSTCYLYYIK